MPVSSGGSSSTVSRSEQKSRRRAQHRRAQRRRNRDSVKVNGVPIHRNSPGPNPHNILLDILHGDVEPKKGGGVKNSNPFTAMFRDHLKTARSINRLAEIAASSDRAMGTRDDFSRNQNNQANRDFGTPAGQRGRVDPFGGAGGGGGRRGGGRNGIDPLDAMLAQLMASVNGQAPGFNFEEILQSNLDAINKSFNAERKAVKQNNKKAIKDTRNNRRSLEHLYGALSHAYGKEAGRQEAETNKDVKDMGGIYNRISQDAERSVGRTNKTEANLMDKLGIEAAAPQTIPGNFKGLQKEQAGLRSEKGLAQQRAENFGENEEDYLIKQKGLAREEGAQRSADQLDSLQDYLFSNRQNLQDIAARRGQALAESEASLSGDYAQMQQDYQNDVWDRLMDVAGFTQDVQAQRSENKLARMGIGLDRRAQRQDETDSKFDNWLDLQKLRTDRAELRAGDSEDSDSVLADTPIGRATQIVSEVPGVTGQSGSRVMSVFNNVLGQTKVRNGFYYNKQGEKITTTPEEARALALQMGRRQGLQGAELRALNIAVLDYFT